jgi:hypothetical protein
MFDTKLPTTFGYKTYAFKYLHLCPALLTKFNSTHFKNLQYSICFIAVVVARFTYSTLYLKLCPTLKIHWPSSP